MRQWERRLTSCTVVLGEYLLHNDESDMLTQHIKWGGGGDNMKTGWLFVSGVAVDRKQQKTPSGPQMSEKGQRDWPWTAVHERSVAGGSQGLR